MPYTSVGRSHEPAERRPAGPAVRGPRGGRGDAGIAAAARGLAACLVTACATAGGPAQQPLELSGITLTLHEESFLVTGRTFAEVGRSLTTMGPSVRNRPAVGAHSSDMRWRFSSSDHEGDCRIYDVRVEIESTIVLPRWTRPAGVDDELVEAWEVYQQGVRDHEEEHRELAIEAALQVQRALRSLRAPACTEELAARANRLGHEIVEDYRDRNLAFDRAAGLATWPPPGW